MPNKRSNTKYLIGVHNHVKKLNIRWDDKSFAANTKKEDKYQRSGCAEECQPVHNAQCEQSTRCEDKYKKSDCRVHNRVRKQQIQDVRTNIKYHKMAKTVYQKLNTSEEDRVPTSVKKKLIIIFGVHNSMCIQWTFCDFIEDYYLTAKSLTSNWSTAWGGISGALPRAPYPSWIK